MPHQPLRRRYLDEPPCRIHATPPTGATPTRAVLRIPRGPPLGGEDQGADEVQQRSTVKILVVDDDVPLRQSCESILAAQGYSTAALGRGDDALSALRRRPFDVLLVSHQMPRMSGLEILKAGLTVNPQLIGIVMTSNPTVESSLSAIGQGAWDYLPKPFSAGHLEVLVGRAAHVVISARSESSRPKANEDDAGRLSPSFPIYGTSEALRHVIALADKVARTNASVFITGESGTGKEVIAQYIHHNSRRGEHELIPVNCAAIPEALMESEMFGHVEGAFTGAVREKQGLLEAADGSSLFLDELTELPLPTQAKLLRVIQDGVVRRVGSTGTDAVVDVRFIAATNRDPHEAIAAGDLRKDLHYRLCVVPIHMPPLRDRPADVPVLAARFLDEFWSRHRDPDATPPVFTEGAMNAMLTAPWPGNVRELRNVVEHAVVLADEGSEIEAEDLAFPESPGVAPSGPVAGRLNDVSIELDYHSAREQVLSAFEVQYLSRVVQSTGGNISDAARIAGVDRTTLYRLMDKHGVRRDGSSEPEGIDESV